eukprot:jgi/Chlat1/1337/Chrsp119S01775
MAPAGSWARHGALELELELAAVSFMAIVGRQISWSIYGGGENLCACTISKDSEAREHVEFNKMDGRADGQHFGGSFDNKEQYWRPQQQQQQQEQAAPDVQRQPNLLSVTCFNLLCLCLKRTRSKRSAPAI